MDILVVDDNEANRKLLNSYLLVQGFKVYEADRGELAIDMFKQHQPDLVLMDVMMPGIGGYEAANEIKACSSSVYLPIIYVTALKPEDAMSEAIEAGGDDFVTKPINFEILISKINAHLRIREESIKLDEANRQLSLHNERLVRENELVEHIFNNALSKSFLSDAFIRYCISPVSAFNGDVLLAEKMPNGNMCVLIGDFTGHGLSAAVGTLPIVKVFFTMVKKGLPIENIAHELNDTIKMLLPTNIFLCASLLQLDGDSKTITFWSGGLPPLILHNQTTKEIESINSEHMPLGILSSKQFDSSVMTLDVKHNEKIYLYTDGIVEARNSQGDMYGQERLLDVVKQASTDPYEELINDHKLFVGDSEQDDDKTLIELRCDQLPI